MALKPTIFKFTVSISDLDRHYYDTLSITVAQHPSETIERMMTRVLAYCLNAGEGLVFTAGLSIPDEPDIWAKSLDDQLLLWLDVGEPSFERIKKASRLSPAVKIYSFNSKSDIWWQQEEKKFSPLNVDIYQFSWSSIQSLALLIERSMEFSITLSDKSIFVATPLGELEILYSILQEKML